MERKIIRTNEAPQAIGPYSQAVLAGNTLYCSGQIAIDPSTGQLVDGSVADETDQVMKNIGGVLRAAGMDYSNIVKCTIFMVDMEDYAIINERYARFFTENPPAREAVAVSALPKGVNVEISVIAVK
ncbi:MAG: RidA family protein [Flavobacteriales bacterium]|nr:RidA family protein [Flavobacteriales bacterium]